MPAPSAVFAWRQRSRSHALKFLFSYTAIALYAAISLTGCAPKDSPQLADSPPEPPAQKEPSKTAPNLGKVDTSAASTAPISLILLDGTTPELTSLLRRLTSGAKTTAAGLRQLIGGLASRLVALPPHKPLARIPFSADSLARRITETTEPIAVTSLESTALALVAARALGANATPVLLKTTRSGATSIRHREYAVQIEAEGFLGTYAVHRAADRDRSSSTVVDTAQFDALLKTLKVLALTEERKFNEATRALAEVTKQLSSDAGVQFLEGHLYLLQGQAEKGIETVSAAVNTAPDAHGWYLLGIAHLREENHFQAYAALQKSVKLDPAYAEPWAALGAILMDRWHNTPADMRAAVTEELDRVESALVKIGKDAFGLVELRIQRLEAKGERSKAKALGAEALNMFPKRSTLHLLMSELREADGEIAQMERHLERAAEVDPDDAEPLMRLASLYAQRNEPERLLQAIQKASQRAPYDPDILDQLTSTLQQLGRMAEAEKTAAELRDRFPELPLGYVRLAEVSIANGNAVGAAALVDQALQKSQKDVDLHVLAYFAHTMAQNPERAAAVVKQFLAFDKDARMKIAEPLLQSGQFEAALQLLEDEVAANPNNIEVIVSLAQLHTLLRHKKDVARLRTLLEKQNPIDGTLQLFDQAIKQVEEEAKKASAPPGDGGPGQ